MQKKGPLYLDIAASLREEIVSKRLAPHSRLPSEPALVKKYRAARATVRRAVAKLQEEGLVYVRRAVGTFVAEPRVEQDLDQLFSFSEVMVYRGMKPGSRLLVSEVQRITVPDSPVLQHLRLKPGARVIHLSRLRLGGGEPLVIANTWLPEEHFPGFPRHDVKRRSVYELMARMGHRPTDAVQTMEAVMLGEKEAGLLTVAPGSAALLIRRVAYAHGLPVEYAVDYYRGDRTRFRVRLGVLEHRLG